MLIAVDGPKYRSTHIPVLYSIILPASSCFSLLRLFDSSSILIVFVYILSRIRTTFKPVLVLLRRRSRKGTSLFGSASSTRRPLSMAFHWHRWAGRLQLQVQVQASSKQAPYARIHYSPASYSYQSTDYSTYLIVTIDASAISGKCDNSAIHPGLKRKPCLCQVSCRGAA
ncbi:hypothetical protein C8T65DRAFT_641666 [Cerioporus squamosus]|nr:hypothetical protein C8T65DRAFT_641666 [Cerioporus squamosus]